MFSEEEQESISIESPDDKLVREIKRKLQDAKTHLSDWRKEARNCYDFYAGKQWSEEDKVALESQNRPAVVFNRVARTTNAIIGLEINNRQEVQYLPREVNDTGANDILTAAAKWAREGCDAEDEESESFKDMVICGMGWTETRMDYETDIDGKIIINRLDPLNMLYDSASKKRNCDDARWIAYVKPLTKEEILETYSEEDLENSDIFGEEDNQPQNTTRDDYNEDEQPNQSKKNYYDVVQFQWYEKKAVNIVQHPVTGEKIELDSKQFTAWQALIPNADFVKIKKRFYKQVVLIGNKIVDRSDLDCGDFTFKAMTGLRDRNKNTWFGIVRLMIDPQMWANKWLSQIQHIINSNAKGGLIAEAGAFANLNKAQSEWAKADAITIVNPGVLSQGKIQQKEAPRYPDGIDRLLQYAVGSINDVTGVNVELLGSANRQQSGVLEQERKESGTNIIADFFDAKRRYTKEQGRLLAHYIIEYISDGRLIRIVGDDGAQYVPLLKERLTLDYDVVVDDTPVTHNQKMKVFEAMVQLLPILQQGGIPTPPELLDYAPIPASLAQKWKQAINQPNPVAQAMQQAEVEGAQLENKKTESEVVLNMAKAQNEAQGNQAEMAQKQQEMQLNAVSEQQKMIYEERKAGMEMQLTKMKMQQEQEKFAQQQQQKNIAFGLDQRRKAIAAAASSSNKSKKND